MEIYHVYIMATESNGVLYIGVTDNLYRRVVEHKTHLNRGFTWRYNITKLVYYETFLYIDKAIQREKQLKKWNRLWKENLIKTRNPGWIDLFATL